MIMMRSRKYSTVSGSWSNFTPNQRVKPTFPAAGASVNAAYPFSLGGESGKRRGRMSNNRVKLMRVFAIESPSARDILANRSESQTLQATIVRSKAEFTTAVNHVTSINEDGLSQKLRGRPLCLHLAAHGNKDGLALGPNSASWKYLAEKLRGFSCAMEHYSGPLLLIISACGAEYQKITGHFAEYAAKNPRFRPAEYVLTTVENDAGDVYWRSGPPKSRRYPGYPR
jgi:hypothetical protein